MQRTRPSLRCLKTYITSVDSDVAVNMRKKKNASGTCKCVTRRIIKTHFTAASSVIDREFRCNVSSISGVSFPRLCGDSYLSIHFMFTQNSTTTENTSNLEVCMKLCLPVTDGLTYTDYSVTCLLPSTPLSSMGFLLWLLLSKPPRSRTPAVE